MSQVVCGGEEIDLDQQNLQMNLNENMLIRLWQMSLINAAQAPNVLKSFLGKVRLPLNLEEKDFVNGNCTAALIRFGRSLLEAEGRETERERPWGMICRWDNINNYTTRAASVEMAGSSPVCLANWSSSGWRRVSGNHGAEIDGPQSFGVGSRLCCTLMDVRNSAAESMIS